jgi:NAD(P)-dependent dehydrogenase (short-subunit alcohol dehydrogenase family)
MGQLDGRGALVTGASAGIGSATSSALAADGAHVPIPARREAECRRVVDQIVAGGSAEPWQADVTSEADVARTVAAATPRPGRLDVAVHDAGVLGEHRPLPNLSEAG